MLWSYSGLQYSTLIKETIHLELGLLFCIFLSRFTLSGKILACSCLLINNLATSSTVFTVTTHEFCDGWAKLWLFHRGKCWRYYEEVWPCETTSNATYTQYIHSQTVFIGSIEFYMVSTQSPVSLWFGYFTLVQLFSSTEPGMPDQECHMNSTLS